MFEIVRVDTSAVHLHYHKNGSLDDPVLVDPIVMPQNANSGASQPIAAIDEETPHEEPIQHEQNDSDASQLAGIISIEEFDLVNLIARYYEAAMEYEGDV